MAVKKSGEFGAVGWRRLTGLAGVIIIVGTNNYRERL
jgi:hypothetical protein